MGSKSANKKEGLISALQVAVCLIISFLLVSHVQAANVRYVYDELNRLSQVLYDDGTLITYSYDNVGNRLVKDVTVIRESLSIPSSPKGATNGLTDISYAFATSGSESNLGHSIEYQFDWIGDGADSSSWGSTNQSKRWSFPGTYGVRARSRCATHTALTSNWSEALPVTIVAPSIILGSPSNDEIFSSCSMIKPHQPSFSWNSIGTFANFTVLFSTSSTDFTAPAVKIASVRIAGDRNNWTPSVDLWKRILTVSNNNGNIRGIYWRVAGKKSDQKTVESEVRGLRIWSPQSATVNTPSNGAGLSSSAPPTFAFDSNCNVKFRLEFSPLNDFLNPKKITGFVFTTKDPTVETVVNRTLAVNQWKSLKQIVGTEGYFRIKAWDGINRQTTSEVRHFVIQ